MGLCFSTISPSQYAKRTGQSTVSDGLASLENQQSPHIVSIHVLDDDSLLNIFHLYRPYFLGEEENMADRLSGGRVDWARQGCWWYRLAYVCQRWRNIILGSASYLRLSLICINGTPVANMLAHSPALPLTVDYYSPDGLTTEDEEGILLALEQHDRLRHLRLFYPAQDLQKLITAINREFPILEYLIMEPLTNTNSGATVMIPETLQTPHLRHLMLSGFTCPIRSQLHPTAANLVTLSLIIKNQSAYSQPNAMLQWISFMPQLENLEITFTFPIPNRDVERQLIHTFTTAEITLPNLRFFWFKGVTAYLEAFVCRITTPRLKDMYIQLNKQLTFSVPHLSQFISKTEPLRIDAAEIEFSSERLRVETYMDKYNVSPFAIKVYCWQLDWQVSSAVQILNALSEVFSAVEHLTLQYEIHSQSSEEHDDIDRIEWRNLLRLFGNVKTLRIEEGLVKDISRCLQLEDGELPLELLPELQQLTYFGSTVTSDQLFIDARKNAGRPVAVIHHNPTPTPTLIPSPIPSPTLSSFGEPVITSLSAWNDIDT